MKVPFIRLADNTKAVKKLIYIATEVGYKEVQAIPGHGVCGVWVSAGWCTLTTQIAPYTHGGRFFYRTRSEAISAILNWDGIADPPGSWLMYKDGDKERLNPNFK